MTCFHPAIFWSRFRCCAALILAAAVLSPTVLGKQSEIEDWYQGPIRYIIHSEERKAFKELTDDNQRTLFIERFWMRRDPTPDTLTNEYRQLFWERVREANDTIQDSPKPGWKTDRGKIYILYGPPTEIKDYVDLAPESSPTSGRGVIRWIYEGRPVNRPDLDPVVVVPFVRDYSGEYHLSYDPKLSSVYFNEYAIRTGERQRWDRYFQSISGVSVESTLSVMLDLGRLQDVPSQENILISHVLDRESFDAHMLQVQVDRMRHPGSGAALASLTVRLPESEPEHSPALMARLTPADRPGEVLILGEDAFRIRPAQEGGLVAQARTTIQPGRWELTVVSANPVSLSTGIHTGTVVIREQQQRLELSDVIVASRLEPVEVRALVSHEEPFLFGPFRVVPSTNRILAPGDSLKLAYEIYDGIPPYTISYQLQGEENDGRWTDLGLPAVKKQAYQPAQAWELPLGIRWPSGRYRIVLNLQDAVGEVVEETVAFNLDRQEERPDPSP